MKKVLLITTLIVSLVIWRSDNFVRDYLAPAGMPLVIGFHAIRSSSFLNGRSPNASSLERAGDWLLSPIQYLFGGKDLDSGDPLFRYDHSLGRNTLICFLAAPTSLVLGSAVKSLGIRYRSSRSDHPVAATHQLDVAGLPLFFSSERAPCQEYPRPTKMCKRHKQELRALQDIVTALEKASIPYWVDCGTALGAYRHGGIIPWDHDIDLAILKPHHAQVKEALAHLDRRRYSVQDWSSYSLPGSFLKVYVKATKTHLDIYHYELFPEEKKLAYLFSYRDSPLPYRFKQEELLQATPVPYDWVFPLKRARFDGLEVWVPREIEAYLTQKYRGNIEPAKIWNPQTAAYEKVAGHPYWDTPHL